jgi:CCR4-NOT transcription complex subunit 6
MHWDPEFSDVKMIQTFLLTTELDRVIRQMGRKPTDVPVILCGDYNSLPTSGVTEFVKEGKVELSHPEFQRFNYNKKLVKMNPKNGEVFRKWLQSFNRLRCGLTTILS